MSAALTWKVSSTGTKTGTGAAELFTDMKNKIDANSGDAAFLWEVRGSNLGSTPYYLVLGRKDDSNGRVLLVMWTSAPAGNNAAILDQAPSTSRLFVSWFPSATADTASNLTASSGTILGDDTNCVKVADIGALTSIYTTSFVPFYAETAESFWVFFQNPASTAFYGGGAGNIIVDLSDTEYGAAMGGGNADFSAFSNASNAIAPWVVTGIAAGANGSNIRTNYGSANRSYYIAFKPNGAWGATAVGATDVLSNTSSNKAWFVPILLIGNTKGEGLLLKLRQIGYGPETSGPFQVYNTTGPAVAATQLDAYTSGGASSPWATNFKI